MFLFLLLIMALATVSAFGLTFLVLRTTRLAPYSLLLSLTSFQPIMVLALSLLGYRAVPLRPVAVLLVIGAGVALTIFALVSHRAEIARVHAERWRTTCYIVVVTLGSMAVATPVLMGRSLAFIDWMNREMVNYSYMAHGFLGLLKDPSYLPFFEGNKEIRYGADLFLAAMAAATGKPPIFLVNLLSAWHKASAIVVFAVGCEIIREDRRLHPAAVVVAVIGFAFSTILSLNHVMAFLAAQAVTPSFVLMTLVFLSDAIRARRVQLFLAAHVLFMVITYGENLPFVAMVSAVIFLEALFLHRKGVAGAVLTTVAVGLLANPLLLAQRLEYGYRLRQVHAGFDVLGSPRSDVVSYVASALGLQYPFIGAHAAPRSVLLVASVFSVSLLLAAFGVAAVRLRSVLLAIIPVLFVGVHFLVSEDWPSYYRSYKTMATLYFFIFLSLIFLLDCFLRRPRTSLRRSVGLVVIGGILAFISANATVAAQGTRWIRSLPSIYLEPDVRRTLELIREHRSQLLVLSHDTDATIWDLFANYYGVTRRLLDRQQAGVLYHNDNPAVLQPTVIPERLFQPDISAPTTLFDGLAVLPTIADYMPAPRGHDLDDVLGAPTHQWRQRSALLQTPAFRLLDGTLVTLPAAAPAVVTNEPPRVSGVLPSQGSGDRSTLVFSFADPNGPSDISKVVVNVTSGRGAYDCYVWLNRSSNLLSLSIDDVKIWDGAIPGSAKRLDNRFCAIDVAASSTDQSDGTFKLAITFQFKPSFAGHKVVEVSVDDRAGLTTGWQTVGFWDVPRR